MLLIAINTQPDLLIYKLIQNTDICLLVQNTPMKKIVIFMVLIAVSFASFASDCLYYHNKARTPLGLPKLTYSSSLAASALKYAKVLAGTSHLKHSTNRKNIGENLAMGTKNAYDLSQLMFLWTNEKRNFISGRKLPNVSRTGNWKDVAHYTQIVWRTTKQVGCAITENKKWRFLVCHYKGIGNFMNAYPY